MYVVKLGRYVYEMILAGMGLIIDFLQVDLPVHRYNRQKKAELREFLGVKAEVVKKVTRTMRSISRTNTMFDIEHGSTIGWVVANESEIIVMIREPAHGSDEFVCRDSLYHIPYDTQYDVRLRMRIGDLRAPVSIEEFSSDYIGAEFAGYVEVAEAVDADDLRKLLPLVDCRVYQS